MNVRLIAYVLLAAGLAWLGVGDAMAVNYADQGAAYAGCWADARQHVRDATGSQAHLLQPECSHTPSANPPYYTARIYIVLSNGQKSYSSWSNNNHFYPRNATCDAVRSSITSTFLPKSGSIACNSGCEFAYYRNSDGTSTAYPIGTVCTNEDMPTNCTGDYYWNPLLNVCEPSRPECEAGEVANSLGHCAPEPCPAGMAMQPDSTCAPKAEECPAGNIKAPSGECLPGEGQCAVGEARRANGTCGKDGDGDGIADVDDDDPDNDGKESASGGDTCDAPPACNGGAIDCMQVKIQWRIDCNTRRNRNISGGACNAMPVCAGEKCDAMEYAQLLQQWRATCHLEKLANATPGEGGLPGGDSGAMDPVSSDGVLGDDLDPSAVQRGAGGGSWDGTPTDLELSEAGYGFGRSCPTLPTVSVMGQSLQFDTTVFCDWMRLGGVFVMIMAHLAGLTLVIRSV